MWVAWALMMVFGLSRGQLTSEPLVETPQGLIRGLRANDGDYSMYLGIPYAKVNKDNPFGNSIPHPKFDDIFEANDDSAECPQNVNLDSLTTGTLDCLNLNIFVPNKASSTNKLPVIIYIHGGSLATGSGNRYVFGPKFLVQHDVILVTVNYRLGPYGFFCLDLPEVPGNQGMKDQTLALRWVKDNIAAFGGDVNKITAMGESAGASCVEYHLYSNQERLFDQAILQSGSVFTHWAFTESDASAPLKIAGRLGFETEDVKEALDFLRDTDTNSVLAAYAELGLSLRVCAEKKFEGVESFLTDHQLNLDLPKIKNIPILSGFNSQENLLTYAGQPASYYKNLTVFKDSLKLGFNYDDDFVAMENLVRNFYIDDEEISEDLKWDLIDFSSDINLNYPVQRSLAKFHDNGAKDIFQYVFSYNGGRNFNKNKYNVTEGGVAHADDLGYLFDYFDKTTPSDEDQRIIDQMTTLWTNFAKYGDPTPDTTELLPVKWIPATKTLDNYLDIDKELTLKKRPFHTRLTFLELFYRANWKKLKFYRENN